MVLMTGSLWRQNWPCNLVLRTQKKKEKLSAHLCSKIASISFFIFAVSSRLKFIFPTSCWHSILLYIRTEIDISYMLLTFHFTIYLDWNWCFPKAADTPCYYISGLKLMFHTSCWNWCFQQAPDIPYYYISRLKLMFPTSCWHCMLLFIETETDVFHKLLTFHVTIYRTEIYVSNKLLKFLVTILMICTAQRQNCPHQLWKMYAWHHSHLLLKNVCLTSFSSLVHTKGVPGLGASPSVLCISLTAVIHVECLGINNVVISLFSCHMKQIYFFVNQMHANKYTSCRSAHQQLVSSCCTHHRGQTALHKAAWYQRRTICHMLVAAGASLTRTDFSGNSPKQQALKAEDKELAAYLES